MSEMSDSDNEDESTKLISSLMKRNQHMIRKQYEKQSTMIEPTGTVIEEIDSDNVTVEKQTRQNENSNERRQNMVDLPVV